MAYDLQEQEQIAELKAAWTQWGRYVAGGVLVLSLAYLGYTGYGLYQNNQAEQASTIYSGAQDLALSADVAKLKKQVDTLTTDYAQTAYATRASFLLAKTAFDANDLTTSANALQWIIDHDKEESAVAMARIRLASVYIDQKKLDEALSVLAKEHPAEFDPFFADRKGDALFAKGQVNAAKDAYRSALAKLKEGEPIRDFVQAKLDALGG